MNELQEKLHTYVKPEYFFWTAVACSLFLVLGAPDVPPAQLSAAPAVTGASVPTENPYDSVTLVAKSAHILDVKSGKTLFEKNAREILPLASITKVMTASTALSLVPETTYITIDDSAIQAEGDSGLRVGERWLLRDLLKFTLLESSNDGAVAVAVSIGGVLGTGSETAEEKRGLFIGKMNELAKKMVLLSTKFESESGLDIDTVRAGAYSTAEETSHMFAYALTQFPSVFTETRFGELSLPSEDGKNHSAENTNKNTNAFPLLLASKTGYTDLAGGNLVVAFNAGFGHPMVISVLGSTEKDRFTDVEKLVWATLDALSEAN